MIRRGALERKEETVTTLEENKRLALATWESLRRGDRRTVVLELVNRSTAANGRAYENEYCFVFEIEGRSPRSANTSTRRRWTRSSIAEARTPRLAEG
jgi:hypothetical protein